MKKFYQSRTNAVFAGVLGGLGEYMNVDPTVLRVVYVIATVLTGFLPLIIAYVVAIFIVPVDRSQSRKRKRTNIIDGDA